MECSETTMPVSDAELLRAAKLGDELAFADLMRRHQALVEAVCRRVVGRHDTVTDAVQATFLVLHRRLAHVDVDRPLGSWLYGVAVRCALKVRDRLRRSRSTAMDSIKEPIKQEAHSEHIASLLDGALASLPERERTALVLVYLEGRTHQQAAMAMAIPSGSLSRAIASGLERLRKCLVRLGVDAASASVIVPPLVSELAVTNARLAPTETAARVASEVGRALPSAFIGIITVKAIMAASIVIAAALTVSLWSRYVPEPATTPHAEAAQAVAAWELPLLEPTNPQFVGGVVYAAWPYDYPKISAPVLTVGALRHPDVVDAWDPLAEAWALTYDATYETGGYYGTWQPRGAPSGVPERGLRDIVQRPTTPKMEELLPQNLLRPAEPGDEVVALLISPDDQYRWAYESDWRPTSLLRIEGGWRLTIDAVRFSARPRMKTPAALRRIHIIRLGRLEAGSYDVEALIHWRTQQMDMNQGADRYVFVDSATQRGAISLNVLPADQRRTENARLESLSELDEEDAVAESARKSGWQLPVQGRTLYFPGGVGDKCGIIRGPGAPIPAWITGEPAEMLAKELNELFGQIIIIASPTIQTLEAVSLRSIEWEGNIVTVTVAVWTDRSPRTKNALWSALLPVHLYKPKNIEGPVTIRVRWQHFIAPAIGQFYELQPQAEFGGVTELADVTLP
jgi:RNA polymerase sigma factor (sigma-70 family)